MTVGETEVVSLMLIDAREGGFCVEMLISPLPPLSKGAKTH